MAAKKKANRNTSEITSAMLRREGRRLVREGIKSRAFFLRDEQVWVTISVSVGRGGGLVDEVVMRAPR